ncbi:MAG: hypothetical protein KF851_08870 [Pirellulaceae bacterium]|nr:hypothetical protein [Pirellulaceae bacterium]
MTTEIPSDLLPFVRRMVAAKRFLSDSDVIAAGIRLLQARETLRDEVTRGFDQLDADLGIPEAQVYDRVEQRIRAIESGEL